MKVRIYCINRNEPSQYYGLISVEGTVLHYAPTWKTEKGAARWAERHGFTVVK